VQKNPVEMASTNCLTTGNHSSSAPLQVVTATLWGLRNVIKETTIMHSRFANLTRVAVVVAVAGLAGCTNITREEFDAVSATANNALSEARAAKAAADAAQSTASDAAYAAQQAQSTADASAQCCRDNTAKIDRMFETTMKK
jgi:hypothetical protein